MFNWLFKRSSQKESDSLQSPQASSAEVDLAYLQKAVEQVRLFSASNSQELHQLTGSEKDLGVVGILKNQQKDIVINQPNIASDLQDAFDDKEGDLFNSRDFRVLKLQEDMDVIFLEREKLRQEIVDLTEHIKNIYLKYPDYIQYENLKISYVDNIGESPRLVFKVDKCTFSLKKYSFLEFVISLRDGNAGLKIISYKEGIEGHAILPEREFLFPELSKKLKEQRDLLLSFDSGYWNALRAAVYTIDSAIKGGWRAADCPSNFDPKFWSSYFDILVLSFRRIPPAFRYETARFKSRKVNIDYEHLWIELSGVTFENISIPTFDVRFAITPAADPNLIQFFKFEFPLINSRIKPFDSWYEESKDDFGGKLELRFDLKKNAFDLNVWSKLSPWDRALVLGLIVVSRDVLLDLDPRLFERCRPLSDWLNCIVKANLILNKYLFRKE